MVKRLRHLWRIMCCKDKIADEEMISSKRWLLSDFSATTPRKSMAKVQSRLKIHSAPLTKAQNGRQQFISDFAGEYMEISKILTKTRKVSKLQLDVTQPPPSNGKGDATCKRHNLTDCSPFGNRYEWTEEQLGAGSEGTVHGCRNTRTGKEYAVKIIEATDSDTHKTAMNEIALLKQIQGQENIIKFHQHKVVGNVYYIMLEKSSGGCLMKLLNQVGYLSEEAARVITFGICKALRHIHSKKIIHRDLKYENVLFNSNTRQVQLCDFGLAFKRRTSIWILRHKPQADRIIGTYPFMSPEVIANRRRYRFYDEAIDMWSLGVMVYGMVCGHPPFDGDCESESCRFLSDELCSSCIELLCEEIESKDIDLDGPKWSKVSEELKEFVTGLLNRNPRKRLTATEAIQHSWLRNQPELKVEGDLCQKDWWEENKSIVAKSKIMKYLQENNHCNEIHE